MAAKLLLPILFLMAASTAVADLYVSPIVRDTVEYDASTDLNGLSGSSIVHGDFSMREAFSLDNNSAWYGSNVPLFVALEYLIPGSEAWKVNLDDGIENRVISWNGGSSWESALTAIADQNGLSIVMNSKENAIGVSQFREVAVALAAINPEVWQLIPSRTLKENLDAWSKQAGWSLSWDENLRVDYPITQKATLLGPFAGEGGAVDRLLAVFRNEPIALAGTFYIQNRVMRITEAGYRKESK